MVENNLIRIAIDGPGGAGKSTIAKLLAKDLGVEYIDTGAMYRAIGLKIIREDIDLASQQPRLQWHRSGRGMQCFRVQVISGHMLCHIPCAGR